jgi:hypothetical protein
MGPRPEKAMSGGLKKGGPASCDFPYSRNASTRNSGYPGFARNCFSTLLYPCYGILNPNFKGVFESSGAGLQITECFLSEGRGRGLTKKAANAYRVDSTRPNIWCAL